MFVSLLHFFVYSSNLALGSLGEATGESVFVSLFYLFVSLLHLFIRQTWLWAALVRKPESPLDVAMNKRSPGFPVCVTENEKYIFKSEKSSFRKQRNLNCFQICSFDLKFASVEKFLELYGSQNSELKFYKPES